MKAGTINFQNVFKHSAVEFDAICFDTENSTVTLLSKGDEVVTWNAPRLGRMSTLTVEGLRGVYPITVHV